MSLKRTQLNRGNSTLKRTPLGVGGYGVGLKGVGFSNKQGFKTSSKNSKLKRFSGKRADIEKEYKKACKRVMLRDGGRCRGCGTTQRLSYSHLIPRSYREDLIADDINIHLHCMNGIDIKGCHDKHDDQEWGDMLDGEVIIETMKELDPEFFHRISKGKYL